MTITDDAELNEKGNFPAEQEIIDQLWVLIRRADVLGLGFLGVLLGHVIDIYEARLSKKQLSYVIKCNRKDVIDHWYHPRSGFHKRRIKERTQIRDAAVKCLATVERLIHCARKTIERPHNGC